MNGYKRTHYCGTLTKANAGQTVQLSGWVQRTRDLGGVVFVWLRDREGMVQLVFDDTVCDEATLKLGKSLRGEYVVTAVGEVRERAPEAVNAQMATGEIEVVVKEAELLNRSETPPIYIDDKAEENETVRLKYRYLDLRKPSMFQKLKLRHEITATIRRYMDSQGFIDVETPILTKSTPEGARDFLVPYRGRAGQFYALPQSPQIYKQLLMLAGFDKYYQVARCFRDEDNRADRQPEFTQVDVEMSFVQPEDVQTVIEVAFAKVFEAVKGIHLSLPLPRMTWKYAMENYGSDKPDTRFDMKLVDATDIARGCAFPVFADAAASGGCVRGINAKGCADMTRKQIDALAEFVKTYRAKGLAWVSFAADGGHKSSFNKFLDEGLLNALRERMGAEPGDILFFVADKKAVALQALGALRLEIAKKRDLIDHNRYDLFWVTEFPLFEYSEEEERYVAMHHPFTSWMEEDEELLETAPDQVRAKAYDLVLNGIEMGSGSIRIHRSDMQSRMFDMIGLSPEEAKHRFGFLLEAFKYGTPPHGGFAFGVDRLVMILTGSENLREVVAFPKAQNANCLMMQTPSDVQEEQLKMLHIRVADDEQE